MHAKNKIFQLIKKQLPPLMKSDFLLKLSLKVYCEPSDFLCNRLSKAQKHSLTIAKKEEIVSVEKQQAKDNSPHSLLTL